MKTFLRNLLFNNWQRKAISAVLSVIIWFVVNHSLTSTKTITNIPVRIMNVPAGKTVEGMQANGILSKRISMTLVGNKKTLDHLSPNDLEVVIDAADKQDEWIASITKFNLISLNPGADITQGISRISTQSLLVRLTKLVTEKITIFVNRPIGEAPRDYQFLDVWPYQLTLSVSGPDKVIKRLKAQELKLTFNLNDITKAQLDALQSQSDAPGGDEISFFVPEQWKHIYLPLISDAPIEIDDPQAKGLRIDFVRTNLIPLERPIPVSLFFPSEYARKLNPQTCCINESEMVEKINSLPMITEPLFTKGVSRLFVQVVREMLEVSVIASPQNERSNLSWSVQFINPRILENRYVTKLMNDGLDDELRDPQPKQREEYLRNRFRSYMNRFRLFKEDDKKLELEVKLDPQNQVHIREVR